MKKFEIMNDKWISKLNQVGSNNDQNDQRAIKISSIGDFKTFKSERTNLITLSISKDTHMIFSYSEDEHDAYLKDLAFLKELLFNQ